MKRHFDGDEEEVGGFVRNPRKRKDRRDDEGRNKRDKMNRVEGGLAALGNADVREKLFGETQSVVPVTTATKPAAVVPAGKKEERSVEKTTVTQQPQPRTFVVQKKEPCPLCGYGKPKEISVINRDGTASKVQPLVCKGCSDRYHAYATGPEMVAKLAAGEQVVVLTRHQWVYSQLDLVAFEQELGAAAAEKDRLNGLVQARIRAAGFLPRETFQSLRDKLQAEPLPGETTTARQAYGRWRRLEARLVVAKAVRPQVEKMVAEESAKRNKAETPPPTAEAKKRTKKAKVAEA